MCKIKTNFSYLLLIIGFLCGASNIVYSQVTITLNKKEPPIWLRNNRFVPDAWSFSDDYYEDPYFGIEKVEKPLPFERSDFDDPYRSRQGSGESDPSSFRKWVPYYDRPSNCSTSTYQPETRLNLSRMNEVSANHRAEIIYQPRALYSVGDYLAKVEGTISLVLQLKADGTVGNVRPLSTLPGYLTKSATQAACYLTFYPAVADGKPIDSERTITYTFSLNQVHEDETAKYPPPPSPDAAVKVIYIARAQYTPEAKQNAVLGNVVLSVTFLASGRIGDIVPIEKLPYGLTEKAIEAAKQMTFEPARKNGKNITQTKTVTYSFSPY